MDVHAASARLRLMEEKLAACGLLPADAVPPASAHTLAAGARVAALEAALARAEAAVFCTGEIFKASGGDSGGGGSGAGGLAAVDAALVVQASVRIARAAEALRTVEAAGAGTDGGAFDAAALIEADALRARVAAAVRDARKAANAAARQRARSDAALAAYGALVDASAALALASEARLLARGGGAAAAVAQL